MQERDIRLLFSAGHWNNALIVPDQASNGWQVLLFAKNNEEPTLLSSKRGGPRTFKASDTALQWCREIGFESVKVHLEPENDQCDKPQMCTQQQNTTILLVEDNEDDITLTRRALARNKIVNEVVVKRDGKEALDYILSIKQQRELPCLVLLDIKLPKLNGLDVLKAIRENPFTRHLPVVMLTTSDENIDIKQSYTLGTNSYIRKPVDFKIFSETIENLGIYWLELNVYPA